MSSERIGAWGDSITRGFRADDQSCWVKRLNDYYAGQKEVLNLGINGEKVADVLNRFAREYKELDNPGTVLLAIGINDSPHSGRTGTPY